MDAKTEQEEKRTKPEKVRLGQKFQLFQPERKGLSLEEPELIPSLPVSVDTFSGNVWLKVGISPFEPKKGYTIDRSDFDIKTRSEKFQKALEAEQYNPNLFYLYVKLGPLENAEIPEALKNLRLQLFFPGDKNDPPISGNNLSFESDSTLDNSSRLLTFSLFYPLDTGPLPKQDFIQGVQSAVTKGHQIFLPKDINKLSRIQAMFVLADEQRDKQPK